MAQRELILKTVMMVTLIAFLGVGFAVAGDGNKNEAAADMEWGYKAARRGYWQEALMRFEHANELTPDQPRILNNIAVAQEANGLYEQALLTYQTGLEIAPNSDALRRNYMRFQEFYTSYIAKPEVGAETDSEEQEADDAQEND